jgi:VanZ family protein
MSFSSPTASGWRHTVFIGYVLFMLLLFLLPVPAGPLKEATHLDKVVHFSVFLVFAVLFRLDKASSAARTLVASLAFAAGIELLQWLLPYRDGDWWDFVAGAAGGIVGAALVFWTARHRRSATSSGVAT